MFETDKTHPRNCKTIRPGFVNHVIGNGRELSLKLSPYMNTALLPNKRVAKCMNREDLSLSIKELWPASLRSIPFIHQAYRAENQVSFLGTHLRLIPFSSL